MTSKTLSKENFHKICVVGGGITGAIMVLLLKNSNMFKLSDIGWVKPKLKTQNDFRTTFYNETSLELLNNLNIFKKLKKVDYTSVKNIKVFGPNYSSPLEWNYLNTKRKFGAVIKNSVVLKIIEEQLKDIKQYDSFVNNTRCNDFERTLYLENKKFIKTHLVLSADGKNSYLRKLLSIKTLNKNSKHVAISGFLEQSKNHNSVAIQAFTNIGPIGILPYENKNLVNFVLSIEKIKFNNLLSKDNPEYFICNELNKFFTHIDVNFRPIKKINNIENKLSYWDLNLNLVLNPTS